MFDGGGMLARRGQEITADQLQNAWMSEVTDRVIEEIVKVVRAVGRLPESQVWYMSPYVFRVTQGALRVAVERGLLAETRTPSGATYITPGGR